MLESTLSVAVDSGTARLSFTVRNGESEPVELAFRNGRRADFAAIQDGVEVWRWSDGRMFTQVLGSETLAPGESATYEAAWEDPPSGEYRLVGELAAHETSVSAESTVTIE